MYRQMARQNPMPQIYCFREDCPPDFACGKFHAHQHHQIRRNNNVRHIVGTIETATIAKEASGTLRTKGDRPQLMALQTHSTNGGAPGGLPNGASLSLSLPPHSPQPASPASQTSQASGLSTSVTLEDIIASARRKISEQFQEIRLPSPEFVEEDSTLWDKRAAKKKLLFPESSLDIPADAGEPISRALNQTLLHQYEDQESEAELVIQEEPPSYIGADDEAEDFEEMLKASKPPEDAYSNPILLRGADPLTTHKKRRHHKMLPRQQSMSRIQQLGGVGPPLSQSSTPSGHTDLGDDFGETSSIDLSMTELSAAVGQGKSPAGSSGPSPSNILKFIEEQKQKGAAAIEGNAEQ